MTSYGGCEWVAGWMSHCRNDSSSIFVIYHCNVCESWVMDLQNWEIVLPH